MAMNVLDAAYHTAHDFPGGVPALAQRMGGASSHVLNKKVDPRIDTHRLTLEESVKMQALTGDCRILQSMAFALNHVAIPLPEAPIGGDMSLLDGFLEVLQELGTFAEDFRRSWADGRITKEEFDKLKADTNEIQGQVAMFISRIGDLVGK